MVTVPRPFSEIHISVFCTDIGRDGAQPTRCAISYIVTKPFPPTNNCNRLQFASITHD